MLTNTDGFKKIMSIISKQPKWITSITHGELNTTEIQYLTKHYPNLVVSKNNTIWKPNGTIEANTSNNNT